ncbi:MAG: DUF1906 domain-containing protein [Lachnospiraceae bacterium]|nr:DUF1906 domain-containing protein [Lachnospiraceae bacterium]
MDEMVLNTQKWLNKTYSGQKGFEPFSEAQMDGITGEGTFKRLIEALQIELNSQYGAKITVDGDFGNGTLKALPPQIKADSSFNNIVCIIQGAFWCKGYSAGPIDGIYGPSVISAVNNFQKDAGITQDGIIRPHLLKGLMNTEGYAFSGVDNSRADYLHQIQKLMNRYYGEKIGLTAPNGTWERKAQTNYIKCCQIEWGASPVDGIAGNGTLGKAPTLTKNTSGFTASKRLLQWGLMVAGYNAGNFHGSFDTDTYNAVIEFQSMMCLGTDGVVGRNTWAALLSTQGSTSRKGTAFDTATRLTDNTAVAMKNLGFTDVGRYLTNVENSTLDKKMTKTELAVLKNAGLNVFPIYQTYGGSASYFTRKKGETDGIEALNAARELGFPSSACIFFAVDYDALFEDIESNIIPYFEGVNASVHGRYVIGVYGPRSVCSRLYKERLCSYSFVADSSSGFTGNIGQPMPENWAYEQFATDAKDYPIPIDKCMVSSRKTAVSLDKLVDYAQLKTAAIDTAYQDKLYEILKACDCYSPVLSLNVYNQEVSIPVTAGVELYYEYSRDAKFFNNTLSIAEFEIENGGMKYSLNNKTYEGLPELTGEIGVEVKEEANKIVKGLCVSVGNGKCKVTVKSITETHIEISFTVTGEVKISDFDITDEYSLEIGVKINGSACADPVTAENKIKEFSVNWNECMNPLKNYTCIAVLISVAIYIANKEQSDFSVMEMISMAISNLISLRK